jgi:uncharacterized membrane protein YjgN (DUF898 family)
MSDSTAPIAASSAPVLHRFEFRGSAGEFFRIWIVNVALILITLGIYSAWAKVRTRRYFYGNTFVAGNAFDYHPPNWLGTHPESKLRALRLRNLGAAEETKR